jgi:predicted Zn-dependent peptidase
MKIKSIALAFLLIVNIASYAQVSYQWKTASSGGYTYKYVTNDPSKSRFYTLKNGLTVILSQNNQEPKIEFNMAVRAGSNTDPKNATGLAHYLEHVMFKGTDKLGTSNWQKEKPLLDKIDALYEKYNKTTDPAQRKEIYKEIDKTSGEASNYSIANEYDKSMKNIGSNSTNAHTWFEETVYEEDLPSNAIDKFLKVQGERFRNPIFRIFHTELEAVYEEKNRTLDDDGRQLTEKTMSLLFPTHNYGQQSTIGKIEHLKNPSLVEIRNYYNKYYVPNNMAAIFSGDFNPDELIKKVDATFGFMVAKPVTLYNPTPEAPLNNIQKVEVLGPTSESVSILYRGFAANTPDAYMLTLIKNILSNGKAGLIDINLNKQQKTQGAVASYQQMKDYGVFKLSASPKNDQSLEDVSKLLLDQIELLKTGQFDESLIKATVANIKLSYLQAFDQSAVRTYLLCDEFIKSKGSNWEKSLSQFDQIEKITKNQVVAFANNYFKNNYVIGFKRKGENKDIVKVEKPTITPINPNSNLTSPFVQNLINEPVKKIEPKFVDFKKDITFSKIGNADLLYKKNTDNGIYRLTYRIKVGSYNNKLLPHAAQYLSFLSTDKNTTEEISKALYNIASTYSVSVKSEETLISITGLQENFKKATEIVEDILANCKPNEKALEQLKARILKGRENNKLNKSAILSGLSNYAQYGSDNPFKYDLNNEEIKNLKAEDLVNILHSLTKFQQDITYYGPSSLEDISKEIISVHKLPAEFAVAPTTKKFEYQPLNTNKVFFADYDMVQAEIRWVRNAALYNPKDVAKVTLFNSYFGGDMGSIVFQTIRESKALAYSTYAYFASPDKKEKQNTVIGYVGAQADKMPEAVTAMNELFNNLPEVEKSFTLSKGKELNSIETTRINKDDIFGYYYSSKKLGYDYDSRIDEYKGLQTLTFSDVKEFHDQNFSKKPFNYCIVASEKKINLDDLKKYGEVTKLSLEEIFGY